MSAKRKPVPVARKSSATIPPTQKPATFYTGPTVPKQQGVGAKQKVEADVALGSSKVNTQGKNVDQIVKDKGIASPVASRALVKRNTPRQPKSHRLLNSTLLFILVASLFSLYACPPPNAVEPSLYTRLNPFIATPHLVPAWERIICQPTNVYREKVLEPYVVPHVKRRIGEIRANPIVREYVEPAVERSRIVAHRVWRDRLEKPVKRVERVIKAVYGRYVSPRVPVIRAHIHRLVLRLRAKFIELQAQITRKITQHPTYVDLRRRVDPHYRRLHAHGRRTIDSWVPRLQHAHRRAMPVVTRLSAQSVSKSRQGWSLTQKQVVPRVARAVEQGLDTAERVWERVVAQIKDLYATRVHPLVHPHYKASLAPHVSTLQSRVYEPYLAEPFARLRPLLYSLVLTPSYADVRRAVRTGYLDTKAAVGQGVESVKEAVAGVEEVVEELAGNVKDKVVPVRDYRAEAVNTARRAAVAVESGVAGAQETVESIVAEVSTSAQSVGGIATQATASVSSVVRDTSVSAESAKAQVTQGVQSATSEVVARASESAAQISASGASVVDRAAESARLAAGRAEASRASIADQASKSGASVVGHATRTVVSAGAEISGKLQSGASAVESVATQASESLSSVVSQASVSGSSVVSQVSVSVSSGAVHASDSLSSGASRAIGSASSVANQVSETVSHVAGQVSGAVSSVTDQASRSVKSGAAAAQESGSSVASRAASAVQPDASTLDPLDPSATEIGSNPGKTTVPLSPEAEQIAAPMANEDLKPREHVADDETIAKDPTKIKQEAAGVIHAYLQTHVPQIAQDRLTALEREATAVTRAFEQLLGSFDLSADAKDVSAERVKVKASLKKVRAKLDELVVALEKDLQAGLINAGAQKEVDKLIDTALASATNPPVTLRKSYQDIVKSVLDTLTHVNDAVAQEGRLVLKPYRKDAKDRADQAIARLEGKVTVVLPSETVGQVAQAAAGTIGRAKNQVIADIKQATEAVSSGYQSATQKAAQAASTPINKAGLDEQAEAVLAGLADFRREVGRVAEDVTSSGKSGAVKATQAIKDEL